MVGRVLTVVVTIALCAMARPAAAQQQPAARGATVSGYHLVLLVADDGGSAGGTEKGTPTQGITPAVAKALKDVQQFLPFKNYRPVDSTLLRGALGGQTRLKGPEGNLYNADVRASINGSEININLFIILPGDKPTTILSTRFAMASGETVVAGTSRLSQGGAAVVALLTAVPESGTR